MARGWEEARERNPAGNSTWVGQPGPAPAPRSCSEARRPGRVCGPRREPTALRPPGQPPGAWTGPAREARSPLRGAAKGRRAVGRARDPGSAPAAARRAPRPEPRAFALRPPRTPAGEGHAEEGKWGFRAAPLEKGGRAARGYTVLCPTTLSQKEREESGRSAAEQWAAGGWKSCRSRQVQGRRRVAPGPGARGLRGGVALATGAGPNRSVLWLPGNGGTGAQRWGPASPAASTVARGSEASSDAGPLC